MVSNPYSAAEMVNMHMTGLQGTCHAAGYKVIRRLRAGVSLLPA